MQGTSLEEPSQERDTPTTTRHADEVY